MSSNNEEKEPQKGKRELLEVPPQSSIDRKFLVNPQAPAPKPSISRLEPNSALLGRLQTFLPQMEQANKNLESIEGFENPVEEGEGPVVELDLACGLFDLKTEEAVSAAERALIDGGVAIERYGGSSSSSSSSEEDSSDSSGSSSSDKDSEGEHEDHMNIDSNADDDSAEPSKTKKKNKKRHPGIEELT